MNNAEYILKHFPEIFREADLKEAIADKIMKRENDFCLNRNCDDCGLKTLPFEVCYNPRFETQAEQKHRKEFIFKYLSQSDLCIVIGKDEK